MTKYDVEPRIRVIFARNSRNFEEVLAGLAADANDATRIAAAIEHDDIECWTEFIDVVRTPPESPLVRGQVIHLVLGDGPTQDLEVPGWGPDYAPELLGAFDNRDAASRCVTELDDLRKLRPGRLTVWSVPIGWYDERLKTPGQTGVEG